MILSRPPPGGVTCIFVSNPVGGQITPLDRASLSLKGSEPPPPPTVGGSPLTSGGHATPCSGANCPWPVDCASAELAIVTPAKVVMSNGKRMARSSRRCTRAYRQRPRARLGRGGPPGNGRYRGAWLRPGGGG